MRSLILLVLVWLAFQFGSLLFAAGSPVSGRGDADVRVHEVEKILGEWPEESRALARRMIAEFGLPDGAHLNVLWWNRTEDARLVIYRDGGDASVPQARRAREGREPRLAHIEARERGR